MFTHEDWEIDMFMLRLHPKVICTCKPACVHIFQGNIITLTFLVVNLSLENTKKNCEEIPDCYEIASWNN